MRAVRGLAVVVAASIPALSCSTLWGFEDVASAPVEADDASPAKDAPDAAAPLPRSCAEAKARAPSEDEDRDVVIDPDGDGPISPFSVFCHPMATGASTEPREYLTLPRSYRNGEPSANVSTIPGGGGGDCASCGDSTIRFDKIRIRPDDLRVLVDDDTFAVREGDIACSTVCFADDPRMKMFGWALSCDTARAAEAWIDLRDTGFVIAEDASFETWGWTPQGTVTYSEGRAVAHVKGGGYCGGYGPAAELPLGR